MKIMCPVSLGELVDKITILEIKKSKITDKVKNAYVVTELAELNAELSRFSQSVSAEIKTKLYETNLELWEIEDKIRDCERLKKFDQDFIELARSVYICNDKRFKYKDLINSASNSSIREVKSYGEY